ncbi:MAG: hypothetical protein ACKOWG_04300, partial [Planctomycetia bacterium]
MPSMPAEMPPVSVARRDRSDALPTAATAQASPHQPSASPNAPVQAAAHADGQAAGPNGPGSRNLSPGEQALVDHVWRHDGDAEVICIVRPRNGQQAASDVFV